MRDMWTMPIEELQALQYVDDAPGLRGDAKAILAQRLARGEKMPARLRVRYDEAEITLTHRFQRALLELMRAECEMMREADPRFADCWTWGRAFIVDLASSNPIRYEYGGADDPPTDGLGDFAVARESRRATDDGGE